MQLLIAAVTRVSGGSPAIGGRAAQRLARRELARSIYQPGIWQRFEHWLGGLFQGVTTVLGAGVAVAIALIVLAVLALAALLYLARSPAARRRHSDALVPAGKPRSADDYRRVAERLAAAGDFSGAITERVRAIAVGLEERAVLPARPGRTAVELAAEAGHALPASRADLRTAARMFNDVRYGEQPGTQAAYQHVRDTDERVQAARPGHAETQADLATAGSGTAPW